MADVGGGHKVPNRADRRNVEIGYGQESPRGRLHDDTLIICRLFSGIVVVATCFSPVRHASASSPGAQMTIYELNF